MKFYKLNLVLALLIVVCNLTGCGIAGSKNQPTETVTISGQIVAPEVNASGILAYSITENASATFAAISASSTCVVNGKTVTMKISSDGSFEIEDATPTASYEVNLTSTNLELSAFSAHTGQNIVLPYGLSLKSTADTKLRQMFANKIGLNQHHLAGYAVNTQLIESLANSMAAALVAATATKDIYDTTVNNRLQAISDANGTFDGMSKNGSAFNFAGEYSGDFFYYLLNSSGEKALAVRSTATVKISVNGSAIYGSVKLEPTASNAIVSGSVSEPSTVSFAFTGTQNGTIATFDQKATLGPLSGRTISSWNLIPVANGLAFKVNNTDTSYYSGIESLISSAVLTKD